VVRQVEDVAIAIQPAPAPATDEQPGKPLGRGRIQSTTPAISEFLRWHGGCIKGTHTISAAFAAP
jgi:hypothetical protein